MPAESEGWGQRIGALTALPALLAELGVEPACVLKAAELPADALSHSENRLPFIAIARTLEEAARQTRCGHIGLLAARDWNLAALGLLGELVRHSATVGEGLGLGVVYQRLNSQGASAFLLKYGSSVQFGYVSFHPKAEAMSTAYDLVMALYVNCLRELCGPDFNPIEVLLPRSAPDDPSPYRRHFRCSVRFDAERAAICLPLELMDRRLPTADSLHSARLKLEASKFADADLLPSLHRSLCLLLLEGNTSGDALAQQLDIHRRTLNRRLKAQGKTFRSVLDNVRFAISRQLLRDTRRSIEEITHTLGYSDASTFTRAFRRWTGMPPVRWRASSRSGPSDAGA